MLLCCRVKIGLSLMKQHNVRGQIPILDTLYHVCISCFKEPLQATREALIGIHQEALLEGKMEFAMSSAFNSCRQSFMSGVNLQEINDDCISVANKMVSFNKSGCVHSQQYSYCC